MLDIIASQYPRLCRAMRRAHGMKADETAALILSIRYPGRVAMWSAIDCAAARRLLADAVEARTRPLFNLAATDARGFAIVEG